MTALLQLQRFFIPGMLILLVWATWKTVFRKDYAVGLALYISLVVVVDGFYNTGLYIPGLEQGSIRYSEICALFLLINREPPITGSAMRGVILFLVGAYFSLMLLAALRADPMLMGIFGFRGTIFPQIVAFVLACRGLRTTDDYRRFVLSLTVLVLVVSVFSFWDIFFDRWIMHSDMLFKVEYAGPRNHGRFGSIFLNPNYLGAFVVLLFPPVFVQLLEERRWRTRIYLGIALLGLVFCLVETQSRAPLLAFGGSVALLALGPGGGISRTRRLAGLAIGILAFSAAMPGYFEHASQRFDTIDEETSTDDVSRASVWQYTRQIIAKHPILGIGFGEQQFLAAMEETDFHERYGRQSLDNPHNSYLQAAVYAGIPAVVIFVVMNFLLLLRAAANACRRSVSGGFTKQSFGIAVGLCGFLVSMYPDMHLFTQNVAPIYWLFVGMLLSFVSKPEVQSPVQQARSRSPSMRYGSAMPHKHLN